MKKLIFIILISIFSYANEVDFEESNSSNIENTSSEIVNDNFADEFDKEFAKTEEKHVFDPLSGYNRVMTNFNDKVYINVLNPVATGYSNTFPQTFRVAMSNFFDNLLFPIRFVNNLLQFKLDNCAEELGRFVVNTIWGLGGFMDPASSELGWEAHKEDFGQTLGFYGVGEGFHIVLPLLGPSNLRDMVGLVADGYVSPVSATGASDIQYKIPENIAQQLGIQVGDTINSTSLRLGQYENIKKDSLDLYPFLRDIYSQSRNKQIEE